MTSARPHGDAAAVLEGSGLVSEARGRRVLDVEHIALRADEILVVLGPNGAGKTTLLRVLSMLQRPTAGSVAYRGESGAGAERRLRQACGVVFQRPHVWSGTVRDNVELGLRLRRVLRDERRARAEASAAQLGIADLLAAPARDLSAGEVQRLAIARALALEPEILILDEPTANLDAAVRRSLREDLERVARSGGRSAILATHDRTEAFYLADRIAVLSEGKVVQIGTPSELFERPVEPYIAEVTGAEFSVRGTVCGASGELLLVRVGETTLTAVGSGTEGDEVKVAYRPEDLFLAIHDQPGGSARNRFPARVLEARSVGGLLRIRLKGPAEMVALVTRAAGEELALTPGREVSVQVKATALHAFPL